MGPVFSVFLFSFLVAQQHQGLTKASNTNYTQTKQILTLIQDTNGKTFIQNNTDIYTVCRYIFCIFNHDSSLYKENWTPLFFSFKGQPCSLTHELCCTYHVSYDRQTRMNNPRPNDSRLSTSTAIEDPPFLQFVCRKGFCWAHF